MPIDNANVFRSMNTNINPTEYIVPVTQVRISRVISVYSLTSGLNRMMKSSWKLWMPPLPLPPQLPILSHRPKRLRITHPSFPSLGARGQLPSGSMLSIWRVLKQFTQLLPSGLGVGIFQKYPPKYPLGNSLKEPSGFFENFIQKVPTMCLSHSQRVLSKSIHQFDHNVPNHIPNGLFESL